jgi:hypothetical protein
MKTGKRKKTPTTVQFEPVFGRYYVMKTGKRKKTPTTVQFEPVFEHEKAAAQL